MSAIGKVMKRTSFWYFESELLLENLEVAIKKLQRNFEFLKFAYIEILLSNNFEQISFTLSVLHWVVIYAVK